MPEIAELAKVSSLLANGTLPLVLLVLTPVSRNVGPPAGGTGS